MDQGILHCNISPWNVYIYDTDAPGQESVPQGGEGFIADFDVAIFPTEKTAEVTETVGISVRNLSPLMSTRRISHCQICGFIGDRSFHGD